MPRSIRRQGWEYRPPMASWLASGRRSLPLASPNSGNCVLALRSLGFETGNALTDGQGYMRVATRVI
jgi:hypothetical protein